MTAEKAATTDVKGRLPTPYWRLWWAGAIDNVGDGAFVTAVPLLAVQLAPTPVLVAAVSAAAYLPWLIFSLPAGALVDRHDRKRLMVCSQLAQAAVVTVAAILVATGEMHVAVLAAMAFMLGACDVVFGNAAQAMLPQIVPGPLLNRANGYQNTVTNTGQQFLGPPAGSFLFAVTAAAPFALNAVSFLGSAALIATLPPGRRSAAEHAPMHTAIRDGLRWLLRHRQLRTLAVLLAVNTFCYAMGTSTLVLLATQTLHVTAGGYGVLLTAAAVGGAIGGVVSERLVAWSGTLPALLASLAANALIFVATGIAPDLVVLAVLLALGGFATTIWSVLTLSLRQQQVPDDLRGRVNSAYRMIGWGLIPLGALAGGLVAEKVGLRAPYPIAGAIRGLALLGALPVLLATMRSPARRHRRECG
ncbi:MFS transporter [Pseudonocardia xinjiangensis]|uniref:MFS transporter n=1 Tax=Pseudonocardia xinjiangensis TaxID=75289 RepID=UPI0028A948C5|nr:MFS transporter [Pseudonocardia xinjiangensis]